MANNLATPTNPTVTATTTSLTFSWDSVTNASYYYVYYKLSTASTWTTTTTTATYYTLSNLSGGVTYQFKVKATSTDSDYIESAETTAISGTITLPQLSAPTGLAITNNDVITSTAKATVTWNPVTNASSYLLEYKKSSASTWTSKSTTTRSVALSSLVRATQYDFRVTAIGDGTNYDDSPASLIVQKKTKAQLSTPTNFTCTAKTDTTLMFTWTAVSGTDTYYVSYKLPSASSWSFIATTTNSGTIPDLTAGTTYYARVSARIATDSTNYDGSVYTSYIQVATLDPLATPIINGLVDKYDGTYDNRYYCLDFTLDSRATGYKLYLDSTGITYTRTAGVVLKINNRPSTDHWTLSGWLSATDSNGNYADSDKVPFSFELESIKTIHIEPPTSSDYQGRIVCYPLMNGDYTNKSWTFKWTDPDNANSPITYNRYYNESTDQAALNIKASYYSGHTVDVAAPEPLTGLLEELTFTTPITSWTLARPLNIGATVNGATVTLAWDAVPYASGYRVVYSADGESDVTRTSATNSIVTTLEPSTAYVAKIYAIGDSVTYFDSFPAQTTFTTGEPTQPLSAPTGLTADQITSTSARVGWNSVTNASGYKIEYRAAGATNWQEENV